jgi:CheY-like chemotaxis protein
MPRKLLLADDSVAIQRVIELTFSDQDVHIVTVADGEQAIARIPVERPDIVLADIGTSKRSGYDVAAFVKGHPDLKHIPVLLLAGAFEPVDQAKARQAGSDGVLVKPFEPQHVIARVRELLNGAKGDPAQAAVPPVARPAERLTRSVDDYFDRLDAQFATMNSPKPAPAADTPEGEVNLVPTLDAVLAKPVVQPPPVEPPDASATLTPGPAEPLPTPRGENHPAAAPTLADAFSKLLAVEQGEPGAVAPRLTLTTQDPVVTDALVDEVARRVLAKLAPEAAREVVVQVVSEVAERLVREEIDRIRGK